MSYSLILPSLTPREAIADALTRALIAFDHNDVTLLNSAFANDVKLSHPAGEMTQVRAPRSFHPFLLVLGNASPSFTSLGISFHLFLTNLKHTKN
jgi:hypothetical protein